MTAVLSLLLFALGLIVGSFLNVVIARVPVGESIVRPGSHCPRCGHVLAWWENIPVLSWAMLRGRCRGCKAPISLRYPAVELCTGLLFLLASWTLPPGWQLFRGVLLVGFLVPLAVIDLEHWIVPVEITVTGTVVGLLTAIPLGRSALLDCAIGAAVGFVAFWVFEPLSLFLVGRIIRPLLRALRPKRVAPDAGQPQPPSSATAGETPELTSPASEPRASAAGTEPAAGGGEGPGPLEQPLLESRESPPGGAEPELTEALGAGDKWLLLLAGAFLGWRPLFGLLLLSSVQGAVVGIVLLALHGHAGPAAPPPGSPAREDGWTPEPTALPFGPWIALAALQLFLLGPWLADSFPSPLVALLTGRAWGLR